VRCEEHPILNALHEQTKPILQDSDLVKLFNPLFSDILEEEQFYKKKPLLAHYTTIETIERIITSKEVWFSNPLYMSDYQEVSFGLLESDRLLSANARVAEALGTPDRSAKFFAAYNSYRQEYIDKHLPDTYVFCLSEHDREDRDGLLSMWRGYGGNGNGAAIVFDTSALNVLPGSPLVIAKVEYATTVERLDWISRKLETFASLLGGMNLQDDKLFLAAHALFHRFKQFALFTKHKGFEEEKEWRIVYMREQDKEHRLSQFFSHFIGARGIAPKLKFKVAHVEGVTASDLSI
jgi:hypothetical protein